MTTIAGIHIPDSDLATDVTDLVQMTAPPLIYHHSRRVFLFGSLQAQLTKISPDPELLYVASMFHDFGLVEPYRTDTRRFELDGAEQARSFLQARGFSAADVDTVWTSIALHTTPEVPYGMSAVIASTTAGVETDVLGIKLADLNSADVQAVIGEHPRPDFKNKILQAFLHGFEKRPGSTFGTVNADVLAHFNPSFRRTSFVDVIQGSSWPE